MAPESSTSTQSEFVKQAFETDVTETAVDELLNGINQCISNLRNQIDDDTLEQILRADTGTYVLRSSMTRDGLQPESFTQQAVIEPLLDALGHEYATEAGGLSGGQTQVADYTISLRDHHSIDSTRLLIEAEPINKALDSREHGIGQVRDWLSQREFESDFGFATDGLRWVFIRYDPDSYSHNVIEEVDLQPIFLALFENQVGKQEQPTEAVFDADRTQVTRLLRTFEFGNFTSIAGNARQVIKQRQEEITDEFYEDYIQYVFGIVDDEERTPRSLIGDGVVKPDGASEEDSRVFAVELMNRLIFIKFLEDKAIVQPDLLRTLKETYEDGIYGGSLYEEFLQLLFYDVMNKKPENRTSQVKNIDLFADIPYLNGGLFRPSIEGESFEETDFDVRNSVLKSIIDLLERYSFSAGGAPTDLDPSVLGNVFEKTVNYITTDNADKNKELGAYYTPSEITRFCAEETVRPALLDRFQTVLVEECDWPEHEAERFDSIFELIDGLPGHMGTIGPLLDEVDKFRVVDPACGSGHFLTSVLEEIVNTRKALYAQNESYPDEYRLKKTTVLNNIYGVDLMGPAVEIGKLRLWLSIISELELKDIDDLSDDELALPNIVFNLREGNSLVGYTGFPETTDNGEFTLDSFSEDSVRDRYQDIIEEIEKHEQSIDSETADRHRRRAFEKLRNAREELIDDIHGDFVSAGIEDITPDEVKELEPFNWVLEFAEVYADGGFDVVVGNPPWEVLAPNRDEFFSRYDPHFRGISPSKKEEKMGSLLADDKISEDWEEYKKSFQRRADYFSDSRSYKLQEPQINGKIVPNNQNDLSALFLERVFSIARPDGYVSQVLPGNIFNGSNSKDVRLHMLNEATLNAVVGFVNNGIFPDIANKYQFGVVVLKNSGRTEALNGIFRQSDLRIIENFQEASITIPRRVLSEYSPEARIFPQLTSEMEVDVLDTIFKHPSLSETDKDWFVEPYRELDKYKDRDRYVDDVSKADYPVLGGRNIYQFVHDWEFLDYLEPPEHWSVNESTDPEVSAKRKMREKEKSRLKKCIYDKFDGSGSQKKFVNELLEEKRGKPLKLDDVLLDCSDYRIVLRNIARPTDERTLIASVIPPGVVCHHAISTVKRFQPLPEKEDLSNTSLQVVYKQIFTDKELFFCLGILNSIPFDFLMRTKVDSNIVQYKLEESQVPRLDEDDRIFDMVFRSAARLNCFGEEFQTMRNRLNGVEPVTKSEERREVQAELDAAAFHAYGLDSEQTSFVLDDFHRVQNPRLMDDAYFEMVLEKYDELDF